MIDGYAWHTSVMLRKRLSIEYFRIYFLNNTERCNERSQVIQRSRYLLHISRWPCSGTGNGRSRVPLQIQDGC